jgi:type IV secretory pathway VirB10-like protein
MVISKTAIGVLAAVCITVGTGSAYLAIRSNETAPVAAGSETTVASTAPSAPAAEKSEPIPVESSVVDDTTQSVSSARSSSPAARRPAPPRPAVSRDAQVEAQVERVPSESAPELDRPPLPAVSLEARSVGPPVLELVRQSASEPIGAQEPPSPEYEELVVAADSVIGLQMESSITSERARVEDPVVARVTRDCIVGGRVVIPAGAEARGEVTLVERGGRLRDRARLGVRFTLIVLPDGMRIPLETETIYREGEARGGESASKIGGVALGGAIIGGLFGGARGAAIGGSVGAGAGTAAALADGRDPATLTRGTPITVRVTAPTVVILHKE